MDEKTIEALRTALDMCWYGYLCEGNYDEVDEDDLEKLIHLAELCKFKYLESLKGMKNQ